MNRTTLFLLAATLLLVIANNDIEVIPIKTPLLPFRLGNARIIQHQHTFLHFVETSQLFNQLRNLEYAYAVISKSLNYTNKHNYQNVHYINGNNLLNNVRYLITQVKFKLGNIKPNNRTKRGLINVGKLSKWLFGTLDSEDGQKYDKIITELVRSKHSSDIQLKKQTSLIQQLIDNYNDTITLLQKNQEAIKKHIDIFEYNSNKTITDITTFIKAQNTLKQIILNCQSFITFLDNLENAITFAKLNTLHPVVISAAELEQIIFKLTVLYGDDQILIFENQNNYYQLANLQVKFTKDKIIFAVHIPIFLKDIFEIFHLFPVPVNHSLIIPNSPYLILGTDMQQYQESICPIIEDTYVCENQLTQPIGDCVTTLIKYAENKNCHVVNVNVSTHIIRPITSRFVLIIPSEQKLKLQMNCQNKEIAFIEEACLINVPYNCGISTQNTELWNKEEIFKANPFSLPPIKIENMEHHDVKYQPLQLQSIDLNTIKKLLLRNHRSPTLVMKFIQSLGVSPLQQESCLF
ncbi:uncharacterized protein LOC132707896 [Cylas formicarius]|uniref:uncharacterized protein LOC132707896 n=1 Tax=Cylas formicarius TaxID=197179 RepID=UPI002958BDCB|nr:uncharacterized protein LOC132707896 [Cylas formicarius]